MGTILTGDGLAPDGFRGEDRYTGFENKTPLVGVSFHGFVGPLISVTIIEFLLGPDSSSSASSENSLKLALGELYNLLDPRFISGLSISKRGDPGDKVLGEDDMLE